MHDRNVLHRTRYEHKKSLSSLTPPMRSRIIHSLRPILQKRSVTSSRRWKETTPPPVDWAPLDRPHRLPSISRTEIFRRKEVQVRDRYGEEGEDVVEEILAARSAIWDGPNGGKIENSHPATLGVLDFFSVYAFGLRPCVCEGSSTITN